MKKVIERIVESPGAPNENDLWLNGTTLKKFQNGEWIPVGGSMGESEEYTIAQALNDLNERIKELQEQTAQQDYFNVHISSIENATNDDKNKIKEIVERGTIFDVVFLVGNPGFESLSRVISYDPAGTVIYLWDVDTESMGVINYTDLI